ncbi:MAG: DUF2244 domain-containing protein [Rhizomicrobium sp.]
MQAGGDAARVKEVIALVVEDFLSEHVVTMSAAGESVLFSATLRPNPPMSAAALKSVIAGMAAINLAFGLYFILRGAWPVTPFMGADVALLAWALRASRHAARRREEVRITPAALRVDRYPARGKPSHVEFNPYWVRVDLDEPVSNSSKLTLASHGRAVQIGAFLPPGEKRSVAQTLRMALRQARETRFD